MTSSGPNTTVLVTIDSLRADALSPTTMPTVARLADEAATATTAFSHGNWTPFSFPSILGADPVFSDAPRLGPSSAPTLAERLQIAGIETVGVNAANGFLTEHWGYNRGFDRFETNLGATGTARFFAAHPTVQGWVQLTGAPFQRLARRIDGGDDRIAVDTSHLRSLEDTAIETITEADGDLFLWLHYMDTHTPYVPAPRHLRAVGAGTTGTARMLRAHIRAGLGLSVDGRALADLRSLYDAAAHQVDASIGRVLAALDRAGRRDDSLVIITGDHGEEFLEHGHLAHYPKLYRELIEVPLVIDHPEATGGTIDAPVGLSAVPATIADATGVRHSDLAGESLLPTLLDGDSPPDDPVISVAVRGDRVTQQPIPRRLDDGELLVSARTKRWTYIEQVSSGQVEVYDRETDPEEQEECAETAPSSVRRQLGKAVQAHATKLVTEGEPDASVPEDVERQLRTLGYR